MTNTQSPTIGDVMTASPKTIDGKATISEAQQQMRALGVNHLPVLVGGLVETVISDRDIARFTLPAHKFGPGEQLLVEDIAPSRAIVADVNDPLEPVLRSMLESRLEAVIILDQGELGGIFTETDACRLLADHLAARQN